MRYPYEMHVGGYDLIGAHEALVGQDYGDPYGWGGVDSLLSGVSLIGADHRTALQHHARQSAARGMHPAVQHQMFQQALQQAAAMKQANAGVIVREQAPTKARRLVLGLVSTGTVAAAAAATITARPQTIAFKPDRLVIPGSIGPDFILTDIKVGNISQLVQSGELSAETFGPLVTESLVDFDTVQTSQDFVLQVQNISGAARTFRATVYGKSVQQ